MKHTFTLLILLGLGNLLRLQAQQIIPCHTDEYKDQILQEHPEYEASEAKFYEDAARWGEQYYRVEKQYKAAPRFIIPVVFHVIHTYGAENISKEQIMDQMRSLNEDFRRLNADRTKTRSIFQGVAADCEIEFRLARKDPNGNCTDGINRIYSPLTDGGDDQVKSIPGTRWDYRKYLNIWVVKDISRGASEGGRVLGYATLPYSTNSSVDGIVMLSDYVGSIGTSNLGRAGRVLTHEVGHWLGLLHPFQNGCGSNCNTSGDRVCDTPPVAEPSFGCNTNANTCSNDSPNQLDQVENYMDYANGSCQNMFTEGQKAIMTGVLTDNRYRASNVSQATATATGMNTDPLCAPVADFFTSDDRIICAGQSISFDDWSYNGAVSEYEWTFEGGSPSFSTFAEPEVTYNTAGVYKVSLKASNASGSSSASRDAFITVLPTVSGFEAPFTEGFDNDDYKALGYRLENDGIYGWKINPGVSLSGSRSAEVFINENTTNAQRYMMYLPPVNLKRYKNLNPKLFFATAYRQRVSEASEILIVGVSTNCGETWRVLNSYNAARGLASDPTPSPNWFPSSSADWVEQSLDLSAYRDSENLWIRFEVMSRQGNSVYLDNINIDQFALNTPALNLPGMRWGLAPNPAGEEGSRLVLEIDQVAMLSAEVHDVSGRMVQQVFTQQELGTGEHQFFLKGLPKGLYFVALKTEGQQQVKKLIIH